MDFHCMKRKQLQALCKKHKIPANLSNLDMANKLTELLKEKETPVIHVVMKEQEENVNEAESNNVIVNREVKKVRFSPEYELIEFTRVQEVKRRSRRNSICRTDSNWSVESGEVNKETVGRWGRTSRTGELKIMEEQINQKKRGVKAVTCNNDGKTIVENDKMEEGDVVEPGRVTRLRRKMEVQGVQNTSTKEKKGAKDDYKRDEKASDDVNNEQYVEIVDNHSRVTRSRAQKLTEAPAEVGKRGRRVVKNIGKLAAVRAEAVNSGEVNKETVGRWGRTSRTGELKIMEEQINQKKRGVKAVTCNNDGKTIVENDKMEEGDVVEPGRVTRLRRKMEVQGVQNTSTKEKKGAKDDYKRDEKASDDVNNEQHVEIVDNHSRVTRSRAQKLTEAPAEVGKRGRRVVKNIGKVAAVRAEAVNSGAESLSKRGDEGEGTSAMVSDEGMLENEEGLKENLVNKQIAGEHVTVEPPVLLRRSKRKVNMVGDSENGGIKEPIKKSKFLASDGSQVVTEVTGSEVNQGRRAVLKIEEPIKKVEPRRSNRRKTVVESDDLKAETENRYPLRTSVPPSDIVPEVSKDGKVVLQPIGVMRRCRRKTLSLKLDSANDTDSAVENLKAEKHVSEPCVDEKENSAVQSNTISRSTSKCSPDKIDGDSNVVQNNKVVKQKRGHVSEGDALKKKNDHNSGAQSLKGSSSKKVKSAVATGNFADEGKQPLLLDSPNMLDASLHSSLEIGESLLLNVQLPVSKDSESASNFSTKDIISDAKLTSTINTCRKIENFSVAASKIAQLERDSTVSEDQNCTSNIREVEKGNSLELEAQQSTEKNITDVDKNPETQVFSQMEDSACNNKINDQVLADGLDVSDETHSSAGSIVKTDLKVAEIEADERLSSNRVVDHHTDLEHLEASNNILNNNDDASQTAGEVGTFVSYETDYAHSTGTLKLKVPSSSLTRHDGDNVAEGNETLLHKGVEELAEAEEDGCSKECGNASSQISEFDMLDNGETCDGESSKGHISKCDEDGEFSLANLFDAEGIYGITPQGIEKFSGETREGESSKGHISKCDENGEFSLVNIFDAERRFGITSQDREKFSGDDEQGMLHGSTSVAPITMCNNSGDHEADLSAEGGKTYDYKDKPSELTEADESGCLESQKSSKDEDWEFSVSNLLDGEKSTRIEPQDLPAVSTVCGYYNEVKSGRDSSNSQETTSTPSSVSEKQDKEDSAGACISDVKNCLISKIAAESLNDMKFQDSAETEQQHIYLQSRLTELNVGEEATHATQRKSWTEIELHNLFGTTSDEDASPGQDDTFCLESEIENLTMSKNKSTCGSLTKQKGKEMEGDSRNECPKTKYKDVVLPTGFNADIYENELKSLFATPVKIMTACKIEKTYSHDRTLDSSVTSIKGCSETRKENVATESMSDGKAQNSGYVVESNLCVGASLSGNGKDDICEEMNDVESVLLLNKSTGVLSGAEYDGCEGLEDQLAQNKEECMKDTNLVTGEDNEEHVIPLAQSCLHDKALENNIISSSCSPWDLYEPESRAHMSETLSCHSKDPNKSEGEMVQNTEAVVESSDTDLQKSEVPENDYLLTAGSDDGNDLRETLVETSSDPEEDKTGSFQIDVADKEHESYVFGAVSGLLSSSAMPSHPGYHENGDMNLEAENLSDNGGDDTCEKINKVESVVLEEYDGCEASEEQLTENTEECEKETNFMTEVGEENVKNSRIYQESEQEMAQSSEAALGLSDADISKNSHPTCCFDDDNISEEASLVTVSGPLVAELANIDCLGIDKGTSLHHSSKVSDVYDDLTQRKDTDLNGAKICDEIDATANSSKDMSDELPINSEVEILKTLQDSDNLCEEADKLPCSAGLESAFLEAKEMDNTTQDPNTIVAPAEHGSSVCGDVSSILSSSEMHLHLRDDNNDIKSLDVVGTPVFNLSRENDKKNSEKAEDNSTTQVVEFPIQELHFEENVEDFKNDTHTISDLPASGYSEMLKESDVADTIKEYIDSESSLSVIFENSTASLSSDMLAHTDDMIDCENSALSKHEDDNAGRLAISKDEDKTPSVDCLETEIKEQNEAALFVEPAQVSGNAVNSAGCVGLFTEGSAVKLDAQKKVETGQRSSSNESCSIMRKNARTILIHGTPNKLLTMADMKENAPTQKSSNIGDITAVRPAKRRALQDIQWK